MRMMIDAWRFGSERRGTASRLLLINARSYQKLHEKMMVLMMMMIMMMMEKKKKMPMVKKKKMMM